MTENWLIIVVGPQDTVDHRRLGISVTDPRRQDIVIGSAQHLVASAVWMVDKLTTLGDDAHIDVLGNRELGRAVRALFPEEEAS